MILVFCLVMPADCHLKPPLLALFLPLSVKTSLQADFLLHSTARLNVRQFQIQIPLTEA